MGVDRIEITSDDFEVLTCPIAFDVTRDKEFGYYHAYNRDLEIHAFGDDVDELRKNAIEEIAFTIGVIMIPEDNMDGGLRKVKAIMEKCVDFDKINPKEYRLREPLKFRVYRMIGNFLRIF